MKFQKNDKLTSATFLNPECFFSEYYADIRIETLFKLSRPKFSWSTQKMYTTKKTFFVGVKKDEINFFVNKPKIAVVSYSIANPIADSHAMLRLYETSVNRLQNTNENLEIYYKHVSTKVRNWKQLRNIEGCSGSDLQDIF